MKTCGCCGELHTLGSFGNNKFCRPCRNRKLARDKPFQHLYFGCLSRATKKSGKLDIDPEFLASLWDKQSGLCYWSKQPMVLEFGNQQPNQASVDRLDNSKGYTQDNVVLVSLAMNYGRNQLPIETWLAYLQSLGILGLLSFPKAS